jgi:hypothetical protein
VRCDEWYMVQMVDIMWRRFRHPLLEGMGYGGGFLCQNVRLKGQAYLKLNEWVEHDYNFVNTSEVPIHKILVLVFSSSLARKTTITLCRTWCLRICPNSGANHPHSILSQPTQCYLQSSTR